MTNGMLWNIHKIARYGDTYMVLDHHKLKFSGNLLIEKVNVSVCVIFFYFHFKISYQFGFVFYHENGAINAISMGFPEF